MMFRNRHDRLEASDALSSVDRVRAADLWIARELKRSYGALPAGGLPDDLTRLLEQFPAAKPVD